jgi:thiamine biosynthesis lipoprotein
LVSFEYTDIISPNENELLRNEKHCDNALSETNGNMRRDAYDAIMVELSRRMPHVTAFPHALGTGLLLHTARPLDDGSHRQIDAFIDEYESVLSRFRSDSLVAAMAKAEHGGTFDFPDWTLPLFTLCDVLAAASAGAIDPCIGEDMIRLGYGADLTFTMQPDAANHLGAIHGRPTWEHDVARDGTTLRTTRPVQLDFGACGKGYLVDLLGMMLRKQSGSAAEFLIDAGGDMLINSRDPIDIALEDPADTNNAVGIAHISSGAFCASAPSRRHWGEAHGLRLHHLLNAIDGQPVNDIAATWVYVNTNSSSVNSPNADSPSATRVSTLPPTAAFPDIEYPTALADGLATALFVIEPQRLASLADFSCAQLLADRRMAASRNFPATFFTAK